MKTTYVRLKPYDVRRRHVLRRYTFRGIKFHVERGWYRVTDEVAAGLREIRQVARDPHSPLAFDVVTEAEATAIDAREQEEATVKRAARADIDVSVPRESGPGATEPARLPSAATSESGGEEEDVEVGGVGEAGASTSAGPRRGRPRKDPS
jgi:hypothetical protein